MTGNKYFDDLEGGVERRGMLWHEYAGIGYLRLQETPYDDDYFEKYVGYANTDFGIKLNAARLAMVERLFPKGSLVDIGIGSGQFMETIGCFGFDINPVAVDLINETSFFLDPHIETVDCATFWDSLEHIVEIAQILAHVRKFAFVSIPIFEDINHVVSSKHFRPDEHCWYFTDAGFKKFMEAHGFAVVEQNTMETDLGREGIGTYACKRVNSIDKSSF